MLGVQPLQVTVVAEALWHRVPGGTGVATRELLSGLARRTDVDLDAVAARRSDDAAGQSPVDVRQVRLPRVALYEAWSRSGRPTIAGPGTQVIHSPMLMAPTAAREPVVVTLHDLAWRHRPDDFPRRALGLYQRMWRRVRRDADHIICSSQATADQAIAAGADAARMSVVYLGGRRLHRAAVESLAHLGVARPFVLSVGTAEPRKNLARLLAAYEASDLWRDEIQLLVVGPTGWRFELADALAGLNPQAAAQVVALGRVTDAELGALYRDAVAFAYPSLLEGFGLPVLEALLASTPVLTSATTATAEVAGDAGVLVNPESVDSIAAGLRQVVCDDALRASLVAAAPGQAARFTWERHLDDTVAIYRRMIERQA